MKPDSADHKLIVTVFLGAALLLRFDLLRCLPRLLSAAHAAAWPPSRQTAPVELAIFVIATAASTGKRSVILVTVAARCIAGKRFLVAFAPPAGHAICAAKGAIVISAAAAHAVATAELTVLAVFCATAVPSSERRTVFFCTRHIAASNARWL